MGNEQSRDARRTRHNILRAAVRQLEQAADAYRDAVRSVVPSDDDGAATLLHAPMTGHWFVSQDVGVIVSVPQDEGPGMTNHYVRIELWKSAIDDATLADPDEYGDDDAISSRLLTPTEARAIAHALLLAADGAEENNAEANADS